MTKPPGEIQTDDTRHNSLTFFHLLENCLHIWTVRLSRHQYHIRLPGSVDTGAPE